MKHISLTWILVLILIAPMVFAENTYNCGIDEGLECVENNCHERYSDGLGGGYLRGEDYGDETWDYMRFNESDCSGYVDFENTTILKSVYIIWYTTSCNPSNSKLDVCNTNTNGDDSIEYCADDSVIFTGACSNTESHFESESNRNYDCDLQAAQFSSETCSGTTCSEYVEIPDFKEAATNDNEAWVVFLFYPFNDQATCVIAGSPEPKLSVTVNQPPLLEGCPDDFTEENSDGSDITINLWDCHYDPDDSHGDNTYTIYSESNFSLIGCNITSNQFVLCDPPTANQTGYSDIVVKVDDGYNTDNDTIRVHVNPASEVSIYINDTGVWSGLSYENLTNIDILTELEDFLDVCENDSKGNCQASLKIETKGRSVNFSLNSIDINYIFRELEFSDALQNYLDNTCTTANCTIPLTFGLGSEGRLNVSDLQIFYSLVNNTSPTINSVTITPTSPYVNDTLDCGFNVTDLEPSDTLTVNVTWFKNDQAWTEDDENNLLVTYGQINHTTSTGDIESSDTSGGEQWICSVNAFDQTAWSGWINSGAVTILGIPTGSSFLLKDNNGNNVTIFDELGSIFLKGNLTESSSKSPTANDEFIIKDTNGNVIIIIDTVTGNFDVKGNLTENQGNLSPPAESDDFIVKNSTGSIVAYINESGFMFLKGYLYEEYL